LLGTIWLAVGLVVAEAMVSRWLVLLQQQMQRHQEVEQRAEAAEAEIPGLETNGIQPRVFADFDIAAISREIQRLTHGGVFVGLLFGQSS
jgi:hypothetical protein